MRDVHTIDDLHRLARRRLPRVVFDYLEGGAGDESAVRRNRAALAEISLVPRYFRDVSRRILRVDLLGESYAAPLGMAPIGLGNLVWPQAEAILAARAREAGLPYVLSTAATTTIEEIAEIAGPSTWFQLYVSSDTAITDDLVRRAAAARVRVLVLTVDTPVVAKRPRDLANGFTLPLRPRPGVIADLARRPAWVFASARAGTPTFRNLEPYARGKSGPQALAAFMAQQITGRMDRDEVARIRRAWDGPFVVKGILHPDDARTAAELGVDGVIVSNHGGRQLEASAASIDMLSRVVEAAGDRLTVMIDGGFRSGGDIVKALALGARAVFCGRPFMYAVAAGGAAGAERVVTMLVDEIDRTLGQIGCPDVADLSPDWLLLPARR